MNIKSILTFLLIASTSNSSQLFKPYNLPNEDVFTTLATLLSNPNEIYNMKISQFMLSVGLQGWTDSYLESFYGNNNNGYEAVLDEIADAPFLDIDIPPAFKNLTLDCKLCLGITFGLKVAIKESNYSFVEQKLIELCESFLEPRSVRVEEICKGTIQKYGPYANILLSQNPFFLRKFCPFMNACLDKKTYIKKFYNTKRNDRNSSEIKVEKELRDEDENDVIKIIQISDIHYEEKYREKTSTTCGLPVCCLEKYGKGIAGEYGDYNCDTSEAVLEGVIKKIVSLKPDVVLFTGDIVSHRFWEDNLESQMNATTYITKLFKTHLLKVYPVIGCSDSHPSHLFSTKYINYTKIFLDHFALEWKNLVAFEREDEINIKTGGFYSQQLFQKLKLLVFNSAYMYTYNFLNALNHNGLRAEAKKTKQFVEDTLFLAKKNDEKVILAFHHPMGTSDFIVSESKWLEKVLLEYKDTIVLVTNGHTHYNEFRVVYDKNNTAALVTFAAPSVSSNRQRNPTMRLYRLNKKSFTLLDYQQYFLDLPQLNNVKSSDVGEHIKLLYSAKSEYQLPDMSPSSWHKLIQRMEDDDGLLLKHMNHYSSNARALSEVGDVQKRMHICRLHEVNYNNYKACVGPLLTLDLPSLTIPSIPNFKPTFTEPSFEHNNAKQNLPILVVLTIFTIFTIIYLG